MLSKGSSFFCSWSGGKDSCLSLYRAMQKGLIPSALLTMMIESGERSRSHGLPANLIQRQALSLGIPITFCSASWNNYEKQFIHTIKDFREEGIEVGIFGDIDLDDHRIWVEKVCNMTCISPFLPLWQEGRCALLSEFLELGFKATIISVKEGILDSRFLGRVMDQGLIAEIENLGVDASGEGGELHTVVTDGPIFSYPIRLKIEDIVLRDGYWFQDVSVAD